MEGTRDGKGQDKGRERLRGKGGGVRYSGESRWEGEKRREVTDECLSTLTMMASSLTFPFFPCLLPLYFFFNFVTQCRPLRDRGPTYVIRQMVGG
ncbi:hypothetical protein IE53DRAFT_277314 [Violaceomyces palustris]|uniref:Uncharacterized protein n=1 Tax=Violaceomyces palustris TaxID=1673888 RepID=A0ACD0NMI7_9BASI|nr:hypothetical protein IE53DRAFT_277314 [Violaceomyces palustris]